jgi:hypothetical protein
MGQGGPEPDQMDLIVRSRLPPSLANRRISLDEATCEIYGANPPVKRRLAAWQPADKGRPEFF